MYKFLAGILALLIANTALALNSEYKNSLTKIDLNKSGESSYNINLYTSNDFSEPIKVIKKSDLKYYILLPETKNSISKTSINSSDIRSIDTQLFPYAGADVKNGYTKININTNKPINFTVNTKNISSLKPQTQVLQENKQEKNPESKTITEDTKAQKKNLVQEKQNSKNGSALKQKTDIVAKKPVNLIPQAAAKIPLKEIEQKKDNKNISTNREPSTKTTQKTPVALPAKVDTKKGNSLEAEKEYQEEIKENSIEEETKQEIQEQVAESISEQTEQIEQTEQPKNPEVAKDNTNRQNFSNVRTKIQTICIGLKTAIKKVQNKLLEYGLNVRELILMIFAIASSFLIILLILNKTKESETRLKSKADFTDKKNKTTPSLVAKKENKGQYFVFDNGIHQTGFIAPTTKEKKNYELSTYEPELRRTSTLVEPYRAKHVSSEYDILQNILKDDTFIELSENEVAHAKEQTTNPVSTYKKEENTKDVKEETTSVLTQVRTDEPKILSNVEIAPQRGFMCVSYNNSISLVGYIFDDVFAIYNFQQSKLDNYNIKFRMSEKTKCGANFIVKVDKTKMLVSVTKSSMSLEVAF